MFNSQLTAYFFNLFFIRAESSRTIFDVWDFFLQDLATTGIHGIFRAGSDRHGNYVAITGFFTGVLVHETAITGNLLEGTAGTTSWFKHKTPNLVSHECRMQ